MIDDDNLTSIARTIPKGSCPNCYNTQFLVVESTCDLFLTSNGGYVKGHREFRHKIVGRCNTCGYTFNMLSTKDGFIPLTEFGKIYYKNIIDNTELINPKTNIINPMLKEVKEK